jgi:hypothetical protein
VNESQPKTQCEKCGRKTFNHWWECVRVDCPRPRRETASPPGNPTLFPAEGRTTPPIYQPD